MWDPRDLVGPDGEDWRVPPTELEFRQQKLIKQMNTLNLESIWINDPVDLYWIVGNRQAGGVHVHCDGEVVQYVRSSLKRAIYESGEDNSPHRVEAHPRMAALSNTLGTIPALQLGRMPANDAAFMQKQLGDGGDCTRLLWNLREIKTKWEIDRMRECGEIQRRMFEAIDELGSAFGEGITEIELAAAADEVSRAEGFGGLIRMRKWPMDCDRVVIASGSSGAIPSYFDSAIGGAGTHPMAALGAGHRRIQKGDPILVDIVHVHRGYITDMTRMFSVSEPKAIWKERLEDMEEIAAAVRNSISGGDTCEVAWDIGQNMARNMGYDEHLMGMPPEQARFLGHSIGLELDETPVVAKGFDIPLEVGGIMAIEPKVIYPEGAVGIEDCWVRNEDGMECLSSGTAFSSWSVW